MTNPYGRAMAQMASVFAELERAMIRERTRAAMGVKRNRRERISRHTPFGFEFGADGKLIPNPAEQEAIALMRRLRSEGKGFEEIAKLLNETGVKPKRAEKWARATVRAILARMAA